MKNVKKAIALVSLAALVFANSTFAADLSLTWSTWTDLSLTWTTLSPLSGQQATGSLDVWVTATVLPLLTVDLSKSTLDFGDLTVWAPNVQSLNVTTATNAKGWVVVNVGSTWLATTEKYIWDLARVWTTPTTGVDSYSISSTTLNWGTALTEANVVWNQDVLVADNVAKSNTTTTVNLKATIDAQTEAWNYTDTLTFTVTWNF